MFNQRIKLTCAHEVTVEIEAFVYAYAAPVSPGVSTPENWLFCSECKEERLISYADVPYRDQLPEAGAVVSDQQMKMFEE